MLTLYTKINLKWIMNFNVKCKTINLSEDNNTGENLDNLGYGNDILDITPKVQSMKEIIDILDFSRATLI